MPVIGPARIGLRKRPTRSTASVKVIGSLGAAALVLANPALYEGRSGTENAVGSSRRRCARPLRIAVRNA